MNQATTPTAAPAPTSTLAPAGAQACPPPWAREAAADFLQRFSRPEQNFPCHFAHQVQRDHALRFSYVDCVAGQEQGLARLRADLTDYIREAPSLGKITSFLSFFNVDPAASASLEEQERWMWSVLQELHDGDDMPWPDDIPTDANDPKWAFSFGGQAFFVVCFSPAHTRRKSRHSAVPMIIFQPRWVFNGLEADTQVGIAVRDLIRRKVEVYDNVPPSDKLTSYGVGLDWEQYFLPENDLAFKECPFTVKTASTAEQT